MIHRPIRAARYVAIAALSLALSAGVCLASPFRFDELARAGRVGGFSISPDGQLVAYAVGTPLVDANRTASSIWLAPGSASGGPARRLTSGDKRDSDPAFSPDGRRIAFLSDREGGSQIWLLDLSGGEPRKATSVPTEVNGFRWAPDGASFVVVSDVFPDCVDFACLAQRVAAREKSVTKAHVSERLLFRHWDSWQNGLRSHIWKVPVGGGSAVDLTPGDIDAPPFAVGGAADYDVSPDGQDFVYASNPDTVQAFSTNGDIWVVPFAGGGKPVDQTPGNRAYDGTPHFSPDGRWIAYRAQKRPGRESDRFTLMLLDRSTGRSRSLTADYDHWVNELAWAPDSKSVYFISEEQAHGVIYRVPVEGGRFSLVWRGGIPSDLTPSRDGKRIYFSASFLTRPAEIYSVPVEGSRSASAVAVTHVNDAMWREGNFGLNAVERWVGSADGQKLQAWLVLPPGFDPAKKYPAVVLIHGGPQGAWHDGWSTRWNPEVFAGYGYVVYAPNIRGSVGFGQKFVDEISGDWGGRAYDDLNRQVDDLLTLPYVDKTKVGAAGGSYGGWMVDWLLGHSDRFAAFVSHDGVFDTRSMSLETEELWFPEAEFGGWPWTSDLYEKWNPSRSVEKFKTPTLVVTSERDYRVPFGQGLQLFTALQLKNVPSKILMFPDEGHWVLKPGNSRLWHATVMDWLHRWLGGAEGEAAALGTAFSVSK